jgi:DNA-binding response OmpR family regulator
VAILIVDDEPIDVEATRKALEAGGFPAVFIADSYDSALQTFEENQSQIAIALLDISLPGKNGVELAKELLQRNPALKVLFVSGHVGAEVIRFYGLRITDRHFLKKPFHAKDLISRVTEVLASTEQLRLEDSTGLPERTTTANGD